MDADLDPPVAALADIRESGILAPFDATNGVPKTAPGLPTWIERAIERPLQSADLDRPQLADSRDSPWRPIAAVEKPGFCREEQLTGAAANSHFRPLAAIARPRRDVRFGL